MATVDGCARPLAACAPRVSACGAFFMSMRITTAVKDTSRQAPDRHLSGAEDRAMTAAIRLARRGVGTTHPNPRVGAVVLRRDGIVGRGFHARAGEAHAEVRALEEAGDRARGQTLVSTLEPCAHQGRTPPCVLAIVAAGIRRVVLGMRGPRPLVAGPGIAAVRAAGIEVIEDVRREECQELNPAYLKFQSQGLPWVMLKSMISLDGRMTSDAGE